MESEAGECPSLPAKEWVPANTRHVDQDHRFPPWINISMRLDEIASGFDPSLMAFWKQTDPGTMSSYLERGGCGSASADLLDYLESTGARNAEMVPAGYISKGAKKRGWFRVDAPQSDPDAFTANDLATMRKQNLNPKKKADRMAYITNNHLEDEFRWIPHSWVEIGDRILDPSGFMPDGKSGQFDRLVKDKKNVHDRYAYFK
jgi:hypothetical protein